MGEMRTLFDQMDNSFIMVVDYQNCNILYMNEGARKNRYLYGKTFFKFQNTDFMHNLMKDEIKVNLKTDEEGEMQFIGSVLRNDFEGNDSLIIMMSRGSNDSNLSFRETGNIVDSLCREYYSLFLVDCETGKYKIVYTDGQMKKFCEQYDRYEDVIANYINTFVLPSDRKLLENVKGIDFIYNKLTTNQSYQINYQMMDSEWRALRFARVDEVNRKQFLAGVVIFDEEMQQYQKSKKIEEIMNKYAESFQALYRVNLKDGSYEIYSNNFKNKDFVLRAKNHLEVEKTYTFGYVDADFRDDLWATARQEVLLEHFKHSDEEVNKYFKEITGKWVKLRVNKDTGYTDENPYVIYAVKECDEEVEKTKLSIVSTTALSKVCLASVIIDKDNEKYEAVYDVMGISSKAKSGPYAEFLDTMRGFIYEEDYTLFLELFDQRLVAQNGFIEREFRAENTEGMAHFFVGMTSYVHVPEGRKILLLIMNNDESVANRTRLSSLNKEYDMTRNVLSTLGDSYFGMYYFDFVAGTIQTLRLPVDMCDIFEKSNKIDFFVNYYVEKMIHEDDRDAVRRCLSWDYINDEYSNGRNDTFCEFQRLIDNKYKWIRLDIRAIVVNDGKVVEAVYAMKDINEEREAELRQNKELMDATVAARKANESKSTFFSNMSHDMRTPLNAILGMTDIAIKHMDNPQRVESSLYKIKSSGQILLYLINNVLDMAYIESGRTEINMAPLSLPELFHGIVILMQDKIRNKHMTFVADAKNVTNEIIMSDKVILNKIIINLLGNAVKYTKDKGQINLQIEQKPCDIPNTATYIITVADTGIGMSEDFLKRLFEPFEREKTSTVSGIEGSGLGMSITKKLIELMGGKINVKSEVNVGSVITAEFQFKYTDKNNHRNASVNMDDFKIFRIDNEKVDFVSQIKEYKRTRQNKKILVTSSYDKEEYENKLEKLGVYACLLEPVFMSDIIKAENNAKEEVTTDKNYSYRMRGKNILIVEDNDINIDIISDYLEDVNAKYEYAKNGKEAYDKVCRNQNYDCILMDIQMPLMNGYDATRLIRSSCGNYGQKVPIIAMTANAFAEDVIKSKNAGMNDHISKPINSEVFYSVVSKYLS